MFIFIIPNLANKMIKLQYSITKYQYKVYCILAFNKRNPSEKLIKHIIKP